MNANAAQAALIHIARTTAEIESLERQVAQQAETLMRRTEEMQQAVKHGYDLTCHANGVSAAATELAAMSVRLDATRAGLKAIRHITDTAAAE